MSKIIEPHGEGRPVFDVLPRKLAMIQTSILDLASSGDLGSRCHDLNHDELRELLGPPSDWGTQKIQERAEIWRYGDIEFHFSERKIYLIFSDHGDMTRASDSLQIDPWVLRRGLALEDFESALAAASIPYETVIPDFDPTQRIVTTISGARFTFTDNPDDDVSGLIAWSIETRAESGSREVLTPDPHTTGRTDP